jgi:hypothetical protein
MNYKDKKTERNRGDGLSGDFGSQVRQLLSRCNNSTKPELLYPVGMAEHTINVGEELNNAMPDIITPKFWLAYFVDSEVQILPDEVVIYSRSYFMAKNAASNAASLLESHFKRAVVFKDGHREVYRTFTKKAA